MSAISNNLDSMAQMTRHSAWLSGPVNGPCGTPELIAQGLRAAQRDAMPAA